MKISLVTVFLLVSLCCALLSAQHQPVASLLTIRHDTRDGTLSIFRSGEQVAIVTQHAKPGIRPYIHPIIAPDGRGELTEFSPPHHKHQTGIYWGLKQVNGRDYFMNWKDDYWRQIEAVVLQARGEEVRWRTRYHLLDEKGSPVLAETQTWSLHEDSGKYIMDLEWRGEAIRDVTMEKFYVGGLFVRMPWSSGRGGEVVNADGRRNSEAEGQRSLWNDIGMKVPGRDDLAHIAILDHPDNKAFPVPWRVDNELGVGPSRQILGDWSIRQGESEIIRYRLVVYTGDRDEPALRRYWKDFVCGGDAAGK